MAFCRKVLIHRLHHSFCRSFAPLSRKAFSTKANTSSHSNSTPQQQSNADTDYSDVVMEYWNRVMAYVKDPSYPFWQTRNHQRQDTGHIKGMHELMRDTLRTMEPTASARNAASATFLGSGSSAAAPASPDLMPDALTRQVCEQYLSLDASGKERFFDVLALDFGYNIEAIEAALRQSLAANSDAAAANKTTQSSDSSQSIQEAAAASQALIGSRVRRLREVAIPTYERLFQQIIKQPRGMKFLIDMRRDLLMILSSSKMRSKKVHLRELDINLQNMLASWFSIGWLDLHRITWNSSAAILEKIKGYESVHAMDGWADLKRRVGPGRRLFCFTHPSLPDEPLVFVQVALTTQLSDSVQQILQNAGSLADEDSATTAIFYSISSTQKGLQGIALGNFLIKRVVQVLQTEFPKISVFSTLSPIPGFVNWLQSKIALHLTKDQQEPTSQDVDEKFLDKNLLTADEARAVLQIAPTAQSPLHALKEILDSGDWNSSVEREQLLKPVLMRLCARYLYLEKHRGKALDPVANFHIRNGARIERLNWLGDTSEKGKKQSASMMVNYRYVLEDIEKNNESYVLNGEIPIGELFKQWTV